MENSSFFLSDDDDSKSSHSKRSNSGSFSDLNTSCIKDDNIRAQMLKEAMLKNKEVTGASTPCQKRFTLGKNGNVYQYVVINMNKEMLNEDSTLFKEIKKYETNDQWYYRALSFIFKALCGKNVSNTFYRDDGKKKPSFYIVCELLCKRLFKENGETDDDDLDKFNNGNSEFFSVPVTDESRMLPFDKLFDRSNRAGYRWHIIVVDPLFSIDVKILKLLKSNSHKNGKTENVAAFSKLDIEEEENENTKKNKNGGDDDDDDNDDDKESDDDSISDDPEEDLEEIEQEGGSFSTGLKKKSKGKKRKKSSKNKKKKPTKRRKRTYTTVESFSGHLKQADPKKLKKKLKSDEGNDEISDDSREKKIECMYKKICNCVEFVEYVLYPLTDHPRFMDVKNLIPTFHDIAESRNLLGGRFKKGPNLANSIVWGNFKVASCILFDPVQTTNNTKSAVIGEAASVSSPFSSSSSSCNRKDLRSIEEEMNIISCINNMVDPKGSYSNNTNWSSRYAPFAIDYVTDVCAEQLNIDNYIKDITYEDTDGEGLYLITFPLRFVTCKYKAGTMLDLKHMAEEKLPFSFSMFDICVDVLKKEHQKRINNLSMTMNLDNEMGMMNTIESISRIRNNFHIENNMKLKKLMRYEKLEMIVRKRNVMKMTDLNEITRKSAIETGGTLLEKFYEMRKLGEEDDWVLVSMPNEHHITHKLLVKEGFYKFKKLLEPNADITNSMKHALLWFKQFEENGNWRDFYSTVPSTDYTKGWLVSFSAKEFLNYETFCLLMCQHEVVRDLGVSQRRAYQYFRALLASGNSMLNINIILMGLQGSGKSHAFEIIKQASIPHTVIDEDSSSEKYRTGGYQNGEFIINDEVGALISGSGAKPSVQDQQALNNQKSMVTRGETTHNVLDFKIDKYGNKERRSKRIRKDQNLASCGGTNYNGIFKDKSVLDRYETKIVGPGERTGKSFTEIAMARLTPEEIRARNSSFFASYRRKQFICMMAAKMMALKALPPCNIETLMIHNAKASAALNIIDPQSSFGIRNDERSQARAMEMAISMAEGYCFESEVSKAEIISEYMQFSYKPFEYKDVLQMAPHMCLSESAAVKIIMESIQIRFPKIEHDIMMWVAVAMCGYKLPREPYLSQEYVDWTERLFRMPVFRDLLSDPAAKVETGPQPQIERVYVDPNNQAKGFYYPYVSVMYDSNDLANYIVNHKMIGLKLGFTQIITILMNLRRKVVEMKYPVYTYKEDEDESDDDEDEEENSDSEDNISTSGLPFSTDEDDDEDEFGRRMSGNGRSSNRKKKKKDTTPKLVIVGFVNISQNVIDFKKTSASSKSGILKLSLGFIDKTPYYYVEKIMRQIMHSNIRESGNLITEQSKIDLQIKKIDELNNSIEEACSKIKNIGDKIGKTNAQSRVITEMECDIRLKIIKSRNNPNNRVQILLKSMESDIMKKKDELDKKRRIIADKERIFIENMKKIQAILNYEKDPENIHAYDEAKKILIEIDNILYLFKKENSVDDEVVYYLRQFVDLVKELNVFISYLVTVKNSMVKHISSYNSNEQLTKSEVIQETLIQCMIMKKEAGWYDLNGYETGEIMEKAITREVNGVKKILRSARYFFTGMTHPRFPYLYDLMKVEAGTHKLRIQNPKVMDKASLKNMTRSMDPLKEQNLSLCQDRGSPFIDYNEDICSMIQKKFLKSICIKEEDHPLYLHQNMDDRIQLVREAQNAHYLYLGKKERYMGRDDYPADFVKGALKNDSLIDMEKKKMQTIAGDPDNYLVQEFMKRDRIEDGIRKKAMNINFKINSKLNKRKTKNKDINISDIENPYDYYSSTCYTNKGSSSILNSSSSSSNDDKRITGLSNTSDHDDDDNDNDRRHSLPDIDKDRFERIINENSTHSYSSVCNSSCSVTPDRCLMASSSSSVFGSPVSMSRMPSLSASPLIQKTNNKSKVVLNPSSKKVRIPLTSSKSIKSKSKNLSDDSIIYDAID